MPPPAKLDYQRGAGLYKARHFAAQRSLYRRLCEVSVDSAAVRPGQTYRKRDQAQQALQSYEQYLATERRCRRAAAGGAQLHQPDAGGPGQAGVGAGLSSKVMPDLLDPALGPDARLGTRAGGYTGKHRAPAGKPKALPAAGRAPPIAQPSCRRRSHRSSRPHRSHRLSPGGTGAMPPGGARAAAAARLRGRSAP